MKRGGSTPDLFRLIVAIPVGLGERPFSRRRAGRGHMGDGGVAPLALRSGFSTDFQPALSASALINRGWAWPKRPSWKSSHGCPVRPRQKGSMPSPGTGLISVRSSRRLSAGFPAGLLLLRSQDGTLMADPEGVYNWRLLDDRITT
jgi:hypothetical protein